jgi:biopolymer transport protein ExbD
MRYANRHGAPFAKGDMTPMIDMTFQLIAFFMVLVNFSEADQNERIRLPLSELAKPPEAPVDTPITLQLTEKGTVIFHANELTIPQLGRELSLEKQFLRAKGKDSATAATVIIRADRAAKMGVVQEVIKTCQDTGFEKFVLRAKQVAAGERA